MLLEILIGKQKNLNESDVQFARRLGVHRTTWQRTRTGDIRVAESIMTGAVKAFPELKDEVLNFLTNDVNKLTENDNKLPISL